MRLIFIRHAEPDYEHNTLTARGFQEAQALSLRVPNWKVDQFFTSPLRRTQLTAEPSLQKINRSAKTLDWMHEFSYAVTDPTTGKLQVPWDFMPQFWTNQPQLFDKDNFYLHPILQSAAQYEGAVHALRKGMDSLLEEYGYYRKEHYYYTNDAMTNGDDETNLVFFGHLGANMEAIGYLIGISPLVLQQSFYLAPTSITILNADKRQPGSPEGWNPTHPNKCTPGIAMFRVQVMGDVQHLRDAGLSVSNSGAFSPTFNG